MIRITPRSLRGFSGTRALTAKTNTAAGWLRSDTTSCSRVAPRPSHHAAEFWLAAGDNADKALLLAKMNLAVRNTPRPRRLPARAVAAKASFVDRSGHADRDFVFTRGREMDINETAVAEEFTK